MLAHNKIQTSTSPKYLPDPPPQQQRPQIHNQCEVFWQKSSRQDFSRREYLGELDDYNRRSHQRHQGLTHKPEHDYDSSQSQDRDQHRQHCVQSQQTPRHHAEQRQKEQSPVSSDMRSAAGVSSVKSTTIHPTIANMVSPSSPYTPSPAPHPAFYHRSLSPIPSISSPFPRNVSMSPERESEEARKHHAGHSHQRQRQPRHHDYLPASPFPQRGTLMEMDHEYAVEELSSDSMMDQCEPQRSWSSSSSQQTNSPSPVMCTPYQFPPKHQPHQHRQHQQTQQQTQQHRDLPPPQQQMLRDQHAQPASFTRHIIQERWEPRYQDMQKDHEHDHFQSSNTHPYRDHHRGHREPGDTSSSSPSNLLPDVTADSSSSPSVRRNSLKIHSARKSRTGLFSVLNDTDVRSLRHSSYSSPVAASSRTFSVDVNRNDRHGSMPKPPTPTHLRLPPSHQQQQHQQRHKYEGESWAHHDDHPKQASALPLRKNLEHMSVAQRMLYERHPPSPKYGQSSPSVHRSTLPSPTSASRGFSTSTSSTKSNRGASSEFTSVTDILASHPPPAHRHEPAIEYDVKSRHPQPGQHQAHQPLPRLSTHEAKTCQPHGEAEAQSIRGHCARSSVSSVSSSSASLPSLSTTAPIYTTPPNGSGRYVDAGASAGASLAPILPATGSMTVVRNEEGAIMAYNPMTDTMTFRCSLCPGESFGRIHDLKRHQTSKHQEMTWPCDFCHRPFVRRDALLRHYTVKAARDDGLHPAAHEVEKLLAARARAKMLY